jgi:hypothetical protein
MLGRWLQLETTLSAWKPRLGALRATLMETDQWFLTFDRSEFIILIFRRQLPDSFPIAH